MIFWHYIKLMLKIPTNNQVFVNNLTKIFEKSFGDRIIFLGLHGSSRYNSLAPEYLSDIDLELILDSVQPNDLILIKNIVSEAPVKVECQLRSVHEITDNDSLIYKTEYKIFMYYAYSNSITLLGENIYQSLVYKFNDDQYKKSLLLSAHLAWKDIRKKYFEQRNSAELNKLIEVFLFDLLLYTGAINFRELDRKKIFELKRYDVYKISQEVFCGTLDENDLRILAEYTTKHATKIFDIEILYPLSKILRFVEKIK